MRMIYKPRPGVVLFRICGRNALTPLREVWDSCKKIRVLSIQEAILWESLKKPDGMQFYFSLMQKLTKKPMKELQEKAEQSCLELCRLGYLIAIPDDAPSDEKQSSTQPQSNAQNNLPQDE